MAIMERHDQGEGSEAAGCAIAAVRRAFYRPPGCAPRPRSLPPYLIDFEAIGTLFRAAHDRMLGLQGVGLVVAPPGTLARTRHERRILRAAAAAQAEDHPVVDAYLFKLAPHREARPALARAVTALATGLASAGQWLPAFPIPAPALQVARLHGVDLGAIQIAWAAAERSR